jgi:hypothetical protein
MVQEIKIFFFFLSILFLLKNVGVFIIKVFQTDPQPITMTKAEIILIYVSISYFLTFIFS